MRLVTVSWDETAKVWEVASGRLLLSLESHTDEVLSASFSADGTRLVTASADKTAKVWTWPLKLAALLKLQPWCGAAASGVSMRRGSCYRQHRTLRPVRRWLRHGENTSGRLSIKGAIRQPLAHFMRLYTKIYDEPHAPHRCAYVVDARVSAPMCKSSINVRRSTRPLLASWLAR